MAEPEVQETASKMAGWWVAARTMLLPFAVIVGVLFAVIIFAGDAWVRGIAKEEIAKGVGVGAAVSVAAHETRLTKVEGDVENHDEDIEDVEDDVGTIDRDVKEFMRDLIDRL